MEISIAVRRVIREAALKVATKSDPAALERLAEAVLNAQVELEGGEPVAAEGENGGTDDAGQGSLGLEDDAEDGGGE